MEEKIQSIECIGFIMDGNRRWAKEKGLPKLFGHRKGLEALKHIVEYVHDAGIPHMVCYAFSTENWNRSDEEVKYLMRLFHNGIRDLGESTQQHSRAIRFIGQRDRIDRDLQKEMNRVEAEMPNDPELTVWVALSYGGRAEIIDGVNKAVAEGRQVTEESFRKFLWSNEMPDPDLIIRTSGEQRLSNFLPWQSIYSELFFANTYWPDFGKDEFHAMLEEYGKRKRRKGK